MRPLNKEFGDIFDRLKRHTDVVDRTSAAIESLREAEFRDRKSHKPNNHPHFC